MAGARSDRFMESWLKLKLNYFCDDQRHLVCLPYSIENLHQMAEDLGVKRCWFHSKAVYPHYDIPKKRIEEIQAKCTKVHPRVILGIAKGRIF